jgi:hypothetical protein
MMISAATGRSGVEFLLFTEIAWVTRIATHPGVTLGIRSAKIFADRP